MVGHSLPIVNIAVRSQGHINRVNTRKYAHIPVIGEKSLTLTVLVTTIDAQGHFETG